MESPCEASLRSADRGCWSLYWGEAGGIVLPGPAGQTAKEECPSPSPPGPPTLPFGRGPGESQHARRVKLECNIFGETKATSTS